MTGIRGKQLVTAVLIEIKQMRYATISTALKKRER